MNRDSVAVLTEAQKLCLRHVLEHQSSKEIGRLIGSSPHTVDTHIRTAMKLLGATNRFEAAKFVRDAADNDGRPLSSQPSRLSELPPSVLAEEAPNQGGLASYERTPRSKLLPLPEFWGDRHDLTNGAKLGWIVLLAIYICISLGALVALFEAVNGIYRPR